MGVASRRGPARTRRSSDLIDECGRLDRRKYGPRRHRCGLATLRYERLHQRQFSYLPAVWYPAGLRCFHAHARPGAVPGTCRLTRGVIATVKEYRIKILPRLEDAFEATQEQGKT